MRSIHKLPSVSPFLFFRFLDLILLGLIILGKIRISVAIFQFFGLLSSSSRLFSGPISEEFQAFFGKSVLTGHEWLPDADCSS